MHKLTFLVVLCLMMASQAVAAIDCRVIGSIERMHAAQGRLMRVSGGNYALADLTMIRQETSRLDTASINYALRDHPSQYDTDNISLFWLRASMLSDLAMQNDKVSMRHFLENRDTTQLHQLIAQIVPRFSCDDRTAKLTTEASGTERAMSGLTQNNRDRKLFGFSISTTIVWITTATLFCGVVISAYYFSTKFAGRKKRRKTRYPVHIETTMRLNGTSVPADVVDISRMGAKVKYGEILAPKTGDSIALKLGERWCRATVTWTNPFYIGMLFAVPMPWPEMRAFLNTSAPDPEPVAETENGARMTDAVSN